MYAFSAPQNTLSPAFRYLLISIEDDVFPLINRHFKMHVPIEP